MLDRSQAPAFSKKFSFHLPQPEILKIADGLHLVLLNGLQQEVVKLEIIFKAGKWYETIPGLSHFTASLIDKGTTSKSSKQIASIFDYYGAQLEISPGYDFVSVSLYALKKHFHELFPVFWEVLNAPSFPGEELQLQKQIFIQNLKVNNQKNSYVASKLLRKNIFGEHHPYGRSIEEGEVAPISVDDLKSFFNANYYPVEIYLIGNLDQKGIGKIMDQFNSTKPKKINERSFVAKAGLDKQTVLREESVQSSIRLGKQTVGRLHPDYFSLLLLNHIFGGYFGSRLMKSIREEKGLTYGIYSSVSPFKNDCMISIGADVNHDKSELAKEEITKELKKLMEFPILPGELTVCKNHFLGSLQLEVANPFAVLEKIKTIRLNGLGKNYYDHLFGALESLSSDDIMSTVQKYFEPDSFLEVAVG